MKSNLKLKRLIPTGLYERLRSLKCLLVLRCYPRKTIDANFGGTPLRIVLADPMAEAWYGKGGGELSEISFSRVTNSGLVPVCLTLVHITGSLPCSSRLKCHLEVKSLQWRATQ